MTFAASGSNAAQSEPGLGTDSSSCKSEHQPGVGGGIPQASLARASLFLTGVAVGTTGLSRRQNEALSSGSGSTSPGGLGRVTYLSALSVLICEREITLINSAFLRGAWRAEREKACDCGHSALHRAGTRPQVTLFTRKPPFFSVVLVSSSVKRGGWKV